MNTNYAFLLFLSVSFSAPLPAISIGSTLAKLIYWPEEVSLETPLTADDTGLLQLDEQRIALLVQKYEKNFKVRDYFKHSALVVNAACVGIILHHLGAFDFLLRLKKSDLTPTDYKDISYELAKLKVRVDQQQALMGIPLKQGYLEWIWGGVKNLSQWVVLTAVLAKLAQIKNYVEVAPSFVWFFTHHEITARVDLLKRNVKAISDFNIPVDYSFAYHSRAIEPTLHTIAKNLEEFIAFMDFYFDRLDKDLIEKQKLDTLSRYLFNVSNDFFKKIHAALKDIQNQQTSPAPMIIDEFISELKTVTKRCQFFEKDFVTR